MMQKAMFFIKEIAFQNVCKMMAILSRPQCENPVTKEHIGIELYFWSLRQYISVVQVGQKHIINPWMI